MRGLYSATVMRMPPGDRRPLLRYLVKQHRDALATLDIDHPGARRHIAAIARIERVARLVGAGSL
ncbi:hypothetical protein [Methylobacterium sp.]|uniref:hypothetical protein n=1 Tax=Methylobacterium sp. TaxID=409 RepID=UPI0025EAD6CA|nr:hypothetical protein [Methylobacterium sp.]MBY0256125.1 hypothetical protein [Methylobacterium sp.]